MNRQVVVQLSADGSAPRVGELVSQEGSLIQVKWDPSDDVEEAQLGVGRTYIAVEGTIQHGLLVDPDGMRERLKNNPTDLFLQRLKEIGDYVPPKDLKSSLAGDVLDRKTVGAAWSSSLTKVLADPHVARSPEKPTRYRWFASEPELVSENSGDVPHEGLADASPEILVDATDGILVDSPHGALADEATAVAAETPEVPAGPPQVDEPQRTTKTPRAAVPSTPAEIQSLLDLAAADRLDKHERHRLKELTSASDFPLIFQLVHACILKSKPDAVTVRELATTPLATAEQLSQFSEATLLAMARAAQLDESHELGLLICCLPKSRSVDKADIPAAMTNVGVRRLMIRILAELNRMNLAARPGAYTGVSSAVRRIVASSIVENIETSCFLLLLRCLREVSSPRPAAAEELEIAVVDLVSGRLRGSKAETLRLTDDELLTLSKAASLLPFARSGGRSGLLAALARNHADDLSNPRWWLGLSPEDLVIAGQGALGNVLTLSAVSAGVIEPLVLATVQSATSRRELSWVLRLPSAVAKQLSVAEASRAAARVASTDVWMADWLNHLRDAHGREEIEAERDRAESLRGQSEAALVRAKASIQELESRNERLQTLVSESHQASGELRSAQERQLKIDVMRAMAQLGAMVTGSAGRLTDEQLVARVESSLARQSVRPIGSRGSQVEFDPSVHDSTDIGLMPGEHATVTRSGYTWHTGQEAIVLVKAVVDRTVGNA